MPEDNKNCPKPGPHPDPDSLWNQDPDSYIEKKIGKVNGEDGGSDAEMY